MQIGSRATFFFFLKEVTLSEIMPFLGRAIRYHRERLGRGPEQVAHGAGMSARTYYRVEEDKRAPSPQELDSICSQLGVTLETLLNRAGFVGGCWM